MDRKSAAGAWERTNLCEATYLIEQAISQLGWEMDEKYGDAFEIAYDCMNKATALLEGLEGALLLLAKPTQKDAPMEYYEGLYEGIGKAVALIHRRRTDGKRR